MGTGILTCGEELCVLATGHDGLHESRTGQRWGKPATEPPTVHNERSQVDQPPHYNSHPSGIECITIVEHMPFNIGNAIKYLWSAGQKENAPTEQDYDKAIWYIQREKERLKK